MYSHKKTAWILGEQGFAKPVLMLYMDLVFIVFHIFEQLRVITSALYIAGAICATIFEYI